MESCSFQSPLLSVMEVLAKAAVAEINRRVDDSCALLRLQVSQSRRDIELLKRKCEGMEAELRRSRVRAKRKASSPPAARTPPPSAKAVWTEETRSTDRDRRADAGAQHHPRQRAGAEPADGAEHVHVKEERPEDDAWKNDADSERTSGTEEPLRSELADNFVDCYHSAENPTNTGPMVSPADGYDTFPEQPLNQNWDEREIVVKDEEEEEEEPDENAAPLDSGHTFVAQEGDGELWPGSGAGDSDPSCARRRFEQIPTVFSPQSSLNLPDLAPRIQSVGKSAMASAARVKRRVRCRRPQPDEGHNALSQVNAIDQSSIPQQSQHQLRDSASHVRDPDEGLAAPNPAASAFRGHSRTSFGLLRRLRTPWTSGVREKRFSCTYCDKSFMRFSQLKEHQRSHTGEKPFSCPLCGRSFTKQCNLIRHAVVHSGEKPYECSLCGKCFTQRSSLKSHQKTAH